MLRASTALDDCLIPRLMAADYYEGDTSSNTINAHDGGADAPLSVISTSWRGLSL